MSRGTTLAISISIALVSVQSSMQPAAASHSFEFVAEHLPEVAMDNRFAALPLWNGSSTAGGLWQFTVQGASTRITGGGLALGGPLVSTALQRQLDNQWSIVGFGFLDDLRFSGGNDQRPLDTLVTTPPLALPAQALFTDLHGTYRNAGAGVGFNLKQDGGWLGAHQWVFGAIYQRVHLRDYRSTYQVLEGPSAGATGFVDYSADYSFFTPFAGLELHRRFGSWSLAPHAQIAIPLPRHPLQGRIAGPGFDLGGDTARTGNGKPFGDFSLTLGLDVVFDPWDFAVDIGSFVSQAIVEPLVHKGIDRNWMISVYKRF